MHQALLSRVDHYLHAVPLSGATGEQVGPFTLFRTTTAWPYYARPTPGTTRTIDAADAVAAVYARVGFHRIGSAGAAE